MAYIKGSSRHENISRSGDNNTIDGRGGSDNIKANGNNNTIIFNKGYKQYTVTASGKNNKIKFGTGISSNNLQFFRYKNNLIIRIKDSIDKIDITNWFSTGQNYKISQLQFNDGSSISTPDIDKRVNNNYRVTIATDKNDTINAPSGNNLIYAMQGNDTIYTRGGNNIIEPSSGNDKVYNYGTGNDVIHSGSGNHYYEDWGGNDTYIFEQGFKNVVIKDSNGNDTIKFGNGISKKTLSFSRSGNNLNININNSQKDKLTIQNWFENNQTKKYKIEKLEFSDETFLTSADIDKKTGNFAKTSNASINNADINKIIQDITVFGANNDIQVNNAASITSNQNLMTMVANSWHA